MRTPGDDSATSRRGGGGDNDASVEDGESGNQDDDEDEDEEDLAFGYFARPHAQTPKWFTPVTTPQEAGLKLLMSGEFGRVGVGARSWEGHGSFDFSKAILSRQSKLRQTPMHDIANVRTTQ